MVPTAGDNNHVHDHQEVKASSPHCNCRDSHSQDCSMSQVLGPHEGHRRAQASPFRYLRMQENLHKVHDSARELQRATEKFPEWQNHERGSPVGPTAGPSHDGALDAMRQLSGAISYVLEDMAGWEDPNEKSSRHQSRQRGPNEAHHETSGNKQDASSQPVCHRCQRTETPQWRRGPDGRKSLCNVCGLVFAKQNARKTTRG